MNSYQREKTKREIIECLRLGMFRKNAAITSGITYKCMHDWMKSDIQFKLDVDKAEKLVSKDYMYFNFLQASKGNAACIASGLRLTEEFKNAETNTEVLESLNKVISLLTENPKLLPKNTDIWKQFDIQYTKDRAQLN